LQTNLSIMPQHFVECLDQQFDAAPAVLRFPNVSAFSREPEHNEIRSDIVSDIDATQRTLERIFSALGIIAGVGAINGHGAEPKSWRHDLRNNSRIVELAFQFRCLFPNLRVILGVDIRHSVIVMKHHGVEPELFKLLEFPNRKIARDEWSDRKDPGLH
jgi:hypothetical protein